MGAGTPQSPKMPPMEEIEEPKNPSHIDPLTDPKGPEIAENWDAEFPGGEKGHAIRYMDGTIRLFREGTTGFVTYLPKPNSIGQYDKYDENGNKLSELITFFLDPDEIFGESAE